jgi:pterin-4a-carbinolamine dehydratase
VSPWPAPERRTWQPRGGVLRPTEVERLLSEHPEWQRSGGGLVREVRCGTCDDALAFVKRVAAEAVDFGRHPDIAITADGAVRLRVANPNHVGITVAEMRLLEDVDEAIARSDDRLAVAA